MITTTTIATAAYIRVLSDVFSVGVGDAAAWPIANSGSVVLVNVTVMVCAVVSTTALVIGLKVVPSALSFKRVGAAMLLSYVNTSVALVNWSSGMLNDTAMKLDSWVLSGVVAVGLGFSVYVAVVTDPVVPGVATISIDRLHAVVV